MEFISITGAYAAITVFLVAGLRHVREPDRFRQALNAQEVWGPFEGPLSRLVPGTELGIGGVGFLSLMGILPSLSFGIVATLAGAIYVAYASLGLFLITRRSGVPCGCASEIEEPTSRWTIARAAVLALLALTAAFGSVAGHPLEFSREGSDGLVAAIAGLTLGLLLWQLPSSMSVPQRIAGAAEPDWKSPGERL